MKWSAVKNKSQCVLQSEDKWEENTSKLIIQGVSRLVSKFEIIISLFYKGAN